jgi:hypothetical protein
MKEHLEHTKAAAPPPIHEIRVGNLLATIHFFPASPPGSRYGVHLFVPAIIWGHWSAVTFLISRDLIEPLATVVGMVNTWITNHEQSYSPEEVSLPGPASTAQSHGGAGPAEDQVQSKPL